MKRFGLLILAAFFASALTINTFGETDLETNKTVKTEHISVTPVVDITYAVNEYEHNAPLAFSVVDAKALLYPVQHKSSQPKNVKNYILPNTTAPV